MKPTPAQRFARLENRRSLLIASIEDLDHETLARQPAGGGWSTLHILAHLEISERASLRYVEKKLKGVDSLQDVGFKERLKSKFLVLLLKLPFKYRAPSRSLEPATTESLASIRERWGEVRGRWRSVIADHQETVGDRMIFRHPVSGPMNLDQTLDFMEAHQNRHALQVGRLLGRSV